MKNITTAVFILLMSFSGFSQENPLKPDTSDSKLKSVIISDNPPAFPAELNIYPLNNFSILQVKNTLPYLIPIGEDRIDRIIRNNLDLTGMFQVQKQHENSSLLLLRKYLGLSRDALAIILLLFHILKYY